MFEEPLPGSATSEEETAALYEAAADTLADDLPANGNVSSRQTQEPQQAHAARPESSFASSAEANGESAGGAPPAVFRVSADQPIPAASPVSDFASPPTSTPAPNAEPAFAGESVDLLRWRAEMLLDEMMVGAVDASAGDQGAFFRQAPPRTRAEWIQDESPVQVAPAAEGAPLDGASGAASNGTGGYSARRAPTPLPAKIVNGINHALAEHVATPANGIVGAEHKAEQAYGMHGAHTYTDGQSGTAVSAANGFVLSNGLRGGTGEQPPLARTHEPDEYNAAEGREDAPTLPAPFRPPPSVIARTAARPDQPRGTAAGTYPIASTDPYSSEALAPADFAADASAQVHPPKAPNRLPARIAPPEMAAPAAPTTPAYQPAASAQGGAGGRKLTAVEQRYPASANRKESAARAAAPPHETARATGTHADFYNVDGDLAGLGPVRRNPSVIDGGTITGSMAVGPRNARYAALLPRSTPWDTHEMAREMLALSDEMARVLPAGHEATRRARHLLDKAQTIFTADPLRSAEVDYYLSQVRAIVERSRQTLQWAGLYRKHLVRYLLAWAVLCTIIVAAALIFGSSMGARIGGAMGWAADGWAINNVAPALLAIYGGALGGAMGGLLNLQRYLAHGVGFIDRKYSLRGLILPVMGMVGGALIFGLLSGIFWIFGISLNSSWLLELLPALLAFGLAFAQESIYGTRE